MANEIIEAEEVDLTTYKPTSGKRIYNDKYIAPTSRIGTEKYEELKAAVTRDVMDGHSRNYIYSKMFDGDYPHAEEWMTTLVRNDTKGICNALNNMLTKIELKIYKKITDEDKQTIKSGIIASYREIYQKALEDDDKKVQLKVLENIAKLLGLNEAQKVEITNMDFNIKMD